MFNPLEPPLSSACLSGRYSDCNDVIRGAQSSWSHYADLCLYAWVYRLHQVECKVIKGPRISKPMTVCGSWTGAAASPILQIQRVLSHCRYSGRPFDFFCEDAALAVCKRLLENTVKNSSITTRHLYLILTFRSHHEIFIRRSWYSVLPLSLIHI